MRAALLPTLVATTLALGCESGSATPAAEPAASAALDGVGRFGAPIQKTRAESLASVLESPAKFDGRTVLVEGKVRRNCTAKGCWMELSTGMDKALPGCRVTFKDYGFFVPLDSAGATARVEGAVASQTVSAREVAHMEGEGATFANKADDGSAVEVRLVATGVELRRD